MDLAHLPEDLRNKCVNTIRFLAIDAVEKAKSGHPGLPMGAADMTFVLWSRFLRFNPQDPTWVNRDRFVFSPGHGSMLLYSLLHLTGHDLSLEDLRQFRQWGSRTAGHPEHELTPGVEVTTGPLGQGFAHAVGLAIGARHLAARLNTPDFSPIDCTIWGVCSDGDLMEGISSEAASLAGHLKLGNLVFLYDSNQITIDGSTDLTFTEDVGARFEAFGWHVLEVDGHDHEQVARALEQGKADPRPSLIIARTTIGFGSPGKAGSNKVHGAPLGPDEAAKTREALGWPAETFHVPAEAKAVFDQIGQKGRADYERWQQGLAAWRQKHPERARLFDQIVNYELPQDLEAQLVEAAGPSGAATRAIGGKVVNRAAALVPGLIGGSADLDESTNTYLKGLGSITAEDFSGRNVHYGIREHAMGATANGLTLFGLRGFTATFLVFSDYMRPSIRLAALMREPTVFVFTHDSVFLGEDGPTHQPIEHVTSLRLIPNLDVWRPADARETALAWAGALRRTTGPSVLVLTRQKLAPLAGDNAQVPQSADEAAAYIVHDPAGGAPDAVVLATGSEVPLAIEAARLVEGKRVRVVSVPCAERFLERTREEREALLPKGVPVAAVEAGRTVYWRQFTGLDGLVIGVDTFGHSAPAEVIAEKLGLTPAQVAARLQEWLA